MATRKIDAWQASDAADTLARAEAIKQDKTLHNASKASASATVKKMQTVINTPSKSAPKPTARKSK